MNRPERAVDARGVPRRVRPPPPVLLGPSPLGLTPQEQERIRARASRIGALGIRQSLLVLAVAFLCTNVVPQILKLPGREVLVWTYPVVFFATVWWMMRRNIDQRGARLCAAYLSLQRCPSCVYSLARLRAEADGCTVCPECGAAWRLATAPAGTEAEP